MDPAAKLLIAAVIGIVGKVVWDWLLTGRVDKGLYVTNSHCEDIRDRCCMPQMKKDVEVLKQEIKQHEKKLDEGRQDFQLLRSDISSIKESLAGIKSILETVSKNTK